MLQISSIADNNFLLLNNLVIMAKYKHFVQLTFCLNLIRLSNVCALSSAGQSNSLLSCGSEVRILQGTPNYDITISLLNITRQTYIALFGKCYNMPCE